MARIPFTNNYQDLSSQRGYSPQTMAAAACPECGPSYGA